MSKRISVWLAVALVVLTAVVTFQITVIFGGGLVEKEEELPLFTTEPVVTTEAPEEEEPLDAVTVSNITKRISEKIEELAAYYAAYYVGELDVDQLVEGAAAGMVAYSGDKYGAYHNAEEYKELTSDFGGEFAGIGIAVIYNSEYGAVEVLNVMPNSPALEAGILHDDLIIKVNGESVAELGYNEAVSKIRGEIGTTVDLTIARGEDYGEVLEVTLTRRKVEEQSVTYEEIETDFLTSPLALIRITDFNNKTPEQFLDAIATGGQNNVHGYIMDLRNNGGGTLNSVVAMLDLLLPEGPIVRIQYRDGSEQVYESKNSSFDEPIVILVNGNTASAAELFTASLRDHGRGIVVGTTTFGKGTVQTLVPLSDGDALRLSSSMYAPPYSDNFEGVGITPHVEVELDEEYRNVNLYKLEYENDKQLQTAVNLYK